jgi:hypothetical protein
MKLISLAFGQAYVGFLPVLAAANGAAEALHLAHATFTTWTPVDLDLEEHFDRAADLRLRGITPHAEHDLLVAIPGDPVAFSDRCGPMTTDISRSLAWAALMTGAPRCCARPRRWPAPCRWRTSAQRDQPALAARIVHTGTCCGQTGTASRRASSTRMSTCARPRPFSRARQLARLRLVEF